MHVNYEAFGTWWIAFCLAVLAGACLRAEAQTAQGGSLIQVRAAGFKLGSHASAGGMQLVLDPPVALPYCQSAVKQSIAPALQGPNPDVPYFTVRFALPVPPENEPEVRGALVGLDEHVLAHNHSPGFTILPNGDALAIWFSARDIRGESENSNNTCFVQARLRYGAEEWDLPELFLDFELCNDQSALLWNDGGTVRFFGGGRGLSPWLPFKQAVSTDNGATWTLTLPQLEQPAEDFTPQPVSSAFRGADGSLYFVMDAAKAASFLWRSADDGVHWRQLPGRTGARHSAVVPLNDQGTLLSIGGKDNAVDGWSPENISTNWGMTWSASTASAFPALGGNQRPTLIRLADGHLFFASDSYIRKSGVSPAGWSLGPGAFVAISTNDGASWHMKNLPVTLPHNVDRHFATLGYVTARQAPNGVIHILTTLTQPCLHYELNEAWVFSAAGDLTPESSGGTVRSYSEKYANGNTRCEWGARICPGGRYLLDGVETDFYDSGTKQHEVTYASGRKTGTETYWSPAGKTVWTWQHDLATHHSVWTQFWPNGGKKSESGWNTQPVARDLNRSFFGLVADGEAHQWKEDGKVSFSGRFINGQLVGKGGAEK